MHKRLTQRLGFFRIGMTVLLLACAALQSQAEALTLGQAANFSVLAGSTITNTGPSVISGDIGVSPGSAITGFPPGSVNGTIRSNDALTQQAQTDLTTAYNELVGEIPTQDLTGQNLGGLTLTPGVYSFSSSAQLTGALILDAQGNSNGRFDFQIGSTLTTASLSNITLINGGISSNVFWQVGSSATLGTNTSFVGNILALTDITLGTGASLSEGRALARNGAVTLDTNTIVVPIVVPEPSSAILLGSIGAFAWMRRRSK